MSIRAKNPIQNVNELIEQYDHMKKQDKMDLSSDQDLTFAIMNLVSIEEHLIFSGAKTGKAKYYELINEVRGMRRDLMKRIIQDYEGEVWCISKHLLAASMRLMEVGNKQLSMEHKDIAYELFQKAYDLYALFWGIQMDVIDVGDVTKIDEDALNKHDMGGKDSTGTKRSGLMGKLGTLVQKVVDCCLE